MEICHISNDPSEVLNEISKKNRAENQNEASIV